MAAKRKKQKRRRFHVEGTIEVTVEATDVLAYDAQDARERVVGAVIDGEPRLRYAGDKRTYIGLEVYGPADGGESANLEAWFESDNY